MKTYNDLIEQWNKCQGSGQVLVDYMHPLRMYLNINDSNNKELLIPVEKAENRFKSTLAIGVNNYRNSEKNFMAVELLDNKYEDEYLSLCFDLIESSRDYNDENKSRRRLFETFRKWYLLFSQSPSDILPEKEIKGLIGEISYIIDGIKAGIESYEMIQAWTVHKDASRDFIFDDKWAEIKAIDNTKDYITISSIEQLDHNTDGNIVVYKLIKGKDGEIGFFSLLSLIEELKELIDVNCETILNYKLLSKGYAYSEKYKDYCYQIVSRDTYNVDESFPRLRRTDIPEAISAVKYDIKLMEIERWRINEK